MAYLLDAQIKDLGGFSVSRILPHKKKKMIGPFIFIDHMGPATFPAGAGINVRAHPHIGLATISYLLEGSMLHRDSLGHIQEIFPGDVNWMTAGKGIVHSERETMEVRAAEHRLNGLQCWLALPREKAHMEPSFVHINKSGLPCIYREKLMMRLIAGEAYGRAAPVKTHSPLFYLDVISEQGAVLAHPNPEQEAAVYIISGELRIGDTVYTAGQFVVLEAESELETATNARYFLLGGERFDTVPFISWNFVAFEKEQIVQAGQRWREGRFPSIPGDDEEFIPLPEKTQYE